MDLNYCITRPKKAITMISTVLLLASQAMAQNSSDKKSPCEDFDNYINAEWKAANPVPATESRWGSFNILNQDNEKKIRGLIEDLQGETYAKNTYQQQIKDLYQSFLNVDARNAQGLEPLKKFFRAIDDAKNFNDLVVLNALIPGTALPVDGGVEQDMMDSKVMAFYLSHSGLSLGDRDYYLSDSEDKVKIREQFKAYIQKLEELLGNSSKKSEKISQSIMSIETDIAHYYIPKEEMRDPFKIYHKFTYEEVKNMSPTINWDAYFRGVNIHPETVIVINPNIIKNYQKIVDGHSLKDWKEYMKFHLVTSMASYLPEPIEKASFDFFNTALSGVKQQKPIIERSIRRINSLLGEPLGRLFVNKYFPASYKADVEHMIENMRAAFKDQINGLTWMSDTTKQAALKKLSTFTYKIGYPNKWTNYSSVDIDSNHVFENVMNIKKFNIQQMLDKYGKPVDKEKWEMDPQTVNAYYNPMLNEIVFPAGILQPPFYEANGDKAANYGGIGAVIGHEFSHGFDDQGSKFDADGNLNDWWTATDRKKFNALTEKLADEYSAYEILPGVHVNGKFTLGENIADQGGIILGYNALMKEMENKPEPPLVDGMNYKQRFFYGWAKVWRSNSTEESLKQLITIDPHAPAKARINVTLSNIQEFYDAFGCPRPAADKMVIIW